MTRGSTLARSVAISVIAAALLFVALVAYAPDATAFSPNNYGWNGMQSVSSKYDLHFVNSLAGLGGNQRSVLVVMQPVSPFTAGEAQNVGAFLRGGGTLVVADSDGMSDSLLQGLGVGVAIQGQYAVLDSTYNWRDRTLPTVLVYPSAQKLFGFLSGVTGIAMNEPSPLLIQPNSGARSVAISSPLSTETSRSSIGGLALVLGNPVAIAKGSFVMAAVQRVGNGTVLVVGDSQFFTNSVWSTADNQVLARNLFANSSVYVDSSHWPPNTIAGLKAGFVQVYGQLSQYPVRYLAVLAFVGVAAALVPTSSKREEREERKKSTVAERDLTPFNTSVLERVRKDRERYGAKPE